MWDREAAYKAIFKYPENDSKILWEFPLAFKRLRTDLSTTKDLFQKISRNPQESKSVHPSHKNLKNVGNAPSAFTDVRAEIKMSYPTTLSPLQLKKICYTHFIADRKKYLSKMKLNTNGGSIINQSFFLASTSLEPLQRIKSNSASFCGVRYISSTHYSVLMC